MSLKLIIISAFLLSSCGVYKWLGSNEDRSRTIASLSVQHLIIDDPENFSDTIDDRLLSLHCYYLIGQKNLQQFDGLIEEKKLSSLYESGPYLNLLAVQSQIQQVELELKEIWSSVGKEKRYEGLKKIIKQRFDFFTKKSVIKQLALENLLFDLGLPYTQHNIKISQAEINAEYKQMEILKEFIVYEKNIEHLSHMMDVKIDGLAKKFYPSTTSAGNVSGDEFAAKVWSITFDDGPGEKTTSQIIKHLKNKNIKATFFQLTQAAIENPGAVDEVAKSGMEIGAHSYTHAQLTKVGGLTLEKEITESIQDLKDLSGSEIRFYRLPFGAGINTPHIREKIAANGMIHVSWNVDSLDWMPQAPSMIVERTIKLMKKTKRDAGIIRLHDTHPRTVDATLHIIDHLKKDGRKVCTLNEIVSNMNERKEIVCAEN